MEGAIVVVVGGVGVAVGFMAVDMSIVTSVIGARMLESRRKLEFRGDEGGLGEFFAWHNDVAVL